MTVFSRFDVYLFTGLLRTFPDIRVLSLHILSDHNDHFRQQDSHNDSGHRALNSETDTVEEVVGRRGCIQPACAPIAIQRLSKKYAIALY